MTIPTEEPDVASERSGRAPWIFPAPLCGILYYFAGVGFAALSAAAPSHSMRTFWRLAAWIVCAAIFAVHIGFERRRERPGSRAALHVAIAVALGAFGLALRVTLRAAGAGAVRPMMPLALVLWPLLTGVPTYLVALAATAILGRRASL